MTSERDFDRIARAWLDQGPDEAPDRAIAAVLLAVDSTPQVRRPFRRPLWRPAPMTRLPLLAALASLIIIAVGALTLSGGAPGPVPERSPTTTGSPTPTDHPSPLPLPADIVGGWVASSRGSSIEDSAITSIAFGGLDGNVSAASRFAIERQGFLPLQTSAVAEVAPGVIQISSTETNGGCKLGDVGRHAWSRSPDGQWLTLRPIADACADRLRVLDGTWQRSLAFDSPGGPGLVTQFSPFMSFTLPAGTFLGSGSNGVDQVVIDGADDGFGFKAWKDPDGFVDPCDPDLGRVDLEPGIDPFIAYMSDDSGMVVTRTTETAIDSRRAVRVDFTTDPTLGPTGCGPEGSVLQWIPNASSGGDWHLLHGLEDTVLVTEMDGTTIVFEIIQATSASGTTDDGFVVPQEVVDSIRFLDALPTPPAP